MPDAFAGDAALLQALSARALAVQPLPPARPDAPPLRPILDAAHLLLPTGLDTACRHAAVAHVAAHLLHSTPAQPAGQLKPLGL
ncbi:MAG: hypothetical protein OEW36_14075, partial [Hylemonella sp.]|nr:hypothetical protein [Hylemonella sp.]